MLNINKAHVCASISLGAVPIFWSRKQYQFNSTAKEIPVVDFIAKRIPNTEEAWLFVTTYSFLQTLGGHYVTKFETGSAKGFILGIPSLIQIVYSEHNGLHKGTTGNYYNIGHVFFESFKLASKTSYIIYQYSTGAPLRKAGEKSNYLNIIGKFGTVSDKAYSSYIKLNPLNITASYYDKTVFYWKFLQENIYELPRWAVQATVITTVGVSVENKLLGLFWDCGAHKLINKVGDYTLNAGRKLVSALTPQLEDMGIAIPNVDFGIHNFRQNCQGGYLCKSVKTTYMFTLMLSSIVLREALVTSILWPVNSCIYDTLKMAFDIAWPPSQPSNASQPSTDVLHEPFLDNAMCGMYPNVTVGELYSSNLEHPY